METPQIESDEQSAFSHLAPVYHCREEEREINDSLNIIWDGGLYKTENPYTKALIHTIKAV